MTRTILHIGAHKTATTYMQKKLALNTDLLASKSIRYESLDTLRKRFTPRLNDGSLAENEFVAELRAARQSMDLLISEENVMGVPGDLVRQGMYYAQGRARLASTVQALGDDEPHIFMALRDYSTFTVSMYSEYIRHREFIHFEPYFEMYKKSEFSWVRVVDDIVAAAPGAKVYLWDFAHFRSTEPEVFAAMLGFDPAILAEPEGPVRESFSNEAIKAIAAMSTVLSHHDLKKLINPVSRNLPKGKEYAAFDPMQPEAASQLKQQYKDDLVAIAQKYPAISFIGPVPAAA